MDEWHKERGGPGRPDDSRRKRGQLQGTGHTAKTKRRRTGGANKLEELEEGKMRKPREGGEGGTCVRTCVVFVARGVGKPPHAAGLCLAEVPSGWCHCNQSCGVVGLKS